MYMLAVSVILSLLCSCVHKEFCYEHPHAKKIRIEFDWREAPDAAPKGMCVFFYPVKGGSPLRRDFKGMEGGEVEINAGRYLVLCYNNDTEGVLFSDMDNIGKHAGYTREGNVLEPIYGNAANYAPQTGGTGTERVVITPDMMWGCTAAEVVISDTGANLDEEHMSGTDLTDGATVSGAQVITLCPRELTCTYTYEVRNVKNLKHAVRMCGTLSGMAPSLRFGDGSLGLECVTLPFDAVSDGVSTIRGKFYTFGHHGQNADPHRMVFYFVMDDGSKYAFGTDGNEKFNVTRQVHGAPDQRHVHIVIDGLDMPIPIENGNGFNVGVDDWIVVGEEIKI